MSSKTIALLLFASIVSIANLGAAEPPPTTFTPLYSIAFSYAMERSDPKPSAYAVLVFEKKLREYNKGDEFKKQDLLLEGRNSLIKIMTQKDLFKKIYSINVVNTTHIGQYDFETHSYPVGDVWERTYPIAKYGDLPGFLDNRYLRNNRWITGIRTKHVTTLIFRNSPWDLRINMAQEKARKLVKKYSNKSVTASITFKPIGVGISDGEYRLLCDIKSMVIRSKTDGVVLATFKNGKLIASE